ncbi:MAG: ABC transporter substrate-binding protein [Acidimicrobiales bacterium]|nr:ABC transporter substrate-binding protein [Acidimicrobiales bacterium]
MGERTSLSLVSVVLVALLAAACGGSRSPESTGPTPPDSTSATSATVPTVAPTAAPESGEVFGNGLAWPCGPGDASGSTDQGITDTSITIGVGDDRGLAASPGLNKEMTDAVLAFVDHCNDLGGIQGRTVEAVVYDAAIFNVATVMTEACSEVFMLVGEGFALDDQGEELRVECGLGAVPAFSVSAAFSHGPLMYQAVANPADQAVMSQAEQVAELFPDRIDHSATLFANFGATMETTQKMLASWDDAGYEFVVELPYNVSGEDDWTPFVREFADAGVRHVYFSGTCLPMYQGARQAAELNGLDAVWTSEANLYSDVCSAANADHAMDRTYIRLVFLPLEEADASPAVADFVRIVTDAGATPSLLGMQGAASFLLWATAANECGSELTSDCVLAAIEAIDTWDSGGLHVPTTPRDNAAPTCGLLVEMVGTTYERVTPTEPGTFSCDPAWSQPVTTAAVEAIHLDENRLSTLYAVPE